MLTSWFEDDINFLKKLKEVDETALKKAFYDIIDNEGYVLLLVYVEDALENPLNPWDSNTIRISYNTTIATLKIATILAIKEEMLEEPRMLYDKYWNFLRRLEEELDEEGQKEYYMTFIDWAVRLITSKFGYYRRKK